MSNNKQTSIDFIQDQLRKYVRYDNRSAVETFALRLSFDKIFDKAREMYQDEIEAAAIIADAQRSTSQASDNSQAFAIGYSQGYTRALQLIQWQIENQLKTHNK
jgi:Arc/MetJ-type ribon-helix-helix transcriptional regulator